MPRFEKWLTGVAGKVRLTAAARRALKSRLRAVQHYLQLAAKSPVSKTDPVHQLRVWSRRSEAVLALFQAELPQAKREWLLRKLKKLRKAAGAARDCDVLLARLKKEAPSPATKELTKTIWQRRKDAQLPLKELWNDLGASGRLAGKVDKTIEKTRWRGSDLEPTFAAWCRTKLTPLVAKFWSRADKPLTRAAALHELRIGGKQLRYAIELVAECYPSSLRKQFYNELSKFQDFLGLVCDHTAAKQQWDELQAALAKPADRKPFVVAARKELQAYQASRKEFLHWWSPERRQKFHKLWERIDKA